MKIFSTAADRSRNELHAWQLWLGVSLLGIVGSTLLTLQQIDAVRQVEQARFSRSADLTTIALGRRIDAYTEIAYGLRDLFIVNPELNRHSFMEAASNLELNKRYPGVKNVAFTRYVTAAKKNNLNRMSEPILQLILMDTQISKYIHLVIAKNIL